MVPNFLLTDFSLYIYSEKKLPSTPKDFYNETTPPSLILLGWSLYFQHITVSVLGVLNSNVFLTAHRTLSPSSQILKIAFEFSEE